MAATDITALWLTLKLAFITSCILLVIGTPLAWWLSGWQSRFKPLVLAIVALPLVLPPTVLGFYLLIAFSPQSEFGALWQNITGKQLAFSFYGILLGSILYSLPFMLQPLYAAFSQLPKTYLDVAHTLGMGKVARFCKIVVPLTKASFISAFGLCFAHTLGEFGVVLMIGGNIPGETQVLSIALFDHVESMQYQQAHVLAAGLLVLSFVLLVVLYRQHGKKAQLWG
ncbi:molybdate ABC transporter permease subunit [Neptunicella marina]|uniref:Molybdenum transport system permease n=1 Tax=Neptunicella marina TaxID=2125989 RepID=A0A8J6IYI8_9ALTE|nr:molybdate ABC transporter permease subunit [Neptunicella marina]MBC3767398.1 molybdate ABC transporter permease subunit [Neptunicella marina]